MVTATISDLRTSTMSTAQAESLVRIGPSRIARAKFAYTTRFAEAVAVDRATEGDLFAVTGSRVAPEAGDLVLARVVDVGRQRRLEGPASRRATLFPGDEIVVAYGDRYAADQYHAVVPLGLEPCRLVAAGGVAGQVVAQNALVDDATTIAPVGLLRTGAGRLTMGSVAPLSLAPADTSLAGRPIVIASFGTSMNSGKSTAAAHLARGLARAGRTVGAAKATGTGAGNDPGLFADAGASEVLDFTHFGFPTTFRASFDDVRALLVSMIDELSLRGCDVIIVEIADGLFQGETRRLLADPVFAGAVDRVVFSAADSLGALAGVELLEATGADVACVSGVLTASPLLEAEAREAVEAPVVNTMDLADADVALRIATPVRSAAA
ncbi:MAG: DUF1611 domain-containing protein [Microbacterium sp.]